MFVWSALRNESFRPHSPGDHICLLQVDLFSFRVLFIVLEIFRHSIVFRTLIIFFFAFVALRNLFLATGKMFFFGIVLSAASWAS